MLLDALLTQLETITEQAESLVDPARNRELDHEALRIVLAQREQEVRELRTLLPTVSPVSYAQYNRIVALVRRGNLLIDQLQTDRARICNALAAGALEHAYASCLQGMVHAGEQVAAAEVVQTR